PFDSPHATTCAAARAVPDTINPLRSPSITDFGASRLSGFATERNLGRRPLLPAPELFLARIEPEGVVLRQHVEPVREPERLGGMRRPIGIAQHLARDRD